MWDILHGYILNLNENKHCVVGLRTVTVPYLSSDKSNIGLSQDFFLPELF